MDKLTPKQEMFVREYVIDFNATQAAIRAGYSKKTASEMGYENLNKPQISAALKELLGDKTLTEKVEVTVERVLEEYSRLAFLDIRDAFDEEGNLIPITEMPEDIARAIGGIEVSSLKLGEDNELTKLSKIKLIDKRGALQDLGKYLKMFIDRVEHTGADGEKLFTESDSMEIARRTAFVLNSAQKPTQH